MTLWDNSGVRCVDILMATPSSSQQGLSACRTNKELWLGHKRGSHPEKRVAIETGWQSRERGRERVQNGTL